MTIEVRKNSVIWMKANRVKEREIYSKMFVIFYL